MKSQTWRRDPGRGFGDKGVAAVAQDALEGPGGRAVSEGATWEPARVCREARRAWSPRAAYGGLSLKVLYTHPSCFHGAFFS